MSTVSPQASVASSERERWSSRAAISDMWASLAISVMWLAVLLDALFGPEMVSGSATSTTTIPSAVFLAFFAYLGTRVVARYGFGRDRD